jgi:hypothetical protein
MLASRQVLIVSSRFTGGRTVSLIYNPMARRSARTVVEPIGQGGMAVVYTPMNWRGIICATILQHMATDGDFARFERCQGGRPPEPLTSAHLFLGYDELHG